MVDLALAVNHESHSLKMILVLLYFSLYHQALIWTLFGYFHGRKEYFVLMVGVSCVPINGTARTIVLLSRSLVTNVGSLSDLLGFTWVSGKSELVFLFSFVLLVFLLKNVLHLELDLHQYGFLILINYSITEHIINIYSYGVNVYIGSIRFINSL